MCVSQLSKFSAAHNRPFCLINHGDWNPRDINATCDTHGCMICCEGTREGFCCAPAFWSAEHVPIYYYINGSAEPSLTLSIKGKYLQGH